jgi:hypothetical protein
VNYSKICVREAQPAICIIPSNNLDMLEAEDVGATVNTRVLETHKAYGVHLATATFRSTIDFSLK